MNNIMKNVPSSIKRLLSKTYIVVIRLGGDTHSNFVNSKPCMHCINYMKNLGIKKIYYSNQLGEIIHEKVSAMSSNHISMIRRVYRTA
jgi:deoxycytidylate deaminase